MVKKDQKFEIRSVGEPVVSTSSVVAHSGDALPALVHDEIKALNERGATIISNTIIPLQYLKPGEHMAVLVHARIPQEKVSAPVFDDDSD